MTGRKALPPPDGADALTAALARRLEHPSPAPVPDVATPRRHDTQTLRRTDARTPGRPDVQTSEAGRIAFTWRLTPDEANAIDALVLKMRGDLGLARLNRAAMLSALCRLAADNPSVYDAVLGELESDG
jgi:hypothetical protein